MPSQAGSARTGTYIVFPQPAGVPGPSRQAGGLQGVAPGPRACHRCCRSRAVAQALSLSLGWFWVRWEDEAQG